MIRVRRSSIRPIADESALVCFLSATFDAAAAPVRGLAIMRPPRWADASACQQAAEHAARLATEIRAGTVFDFWMQMRDALEYWRIANEKSDAAAAFGLAIMERALVEAFCRALGKPFAVALRDGDLRIDLGKLCRPLAGRTPKELLPSASTQLTLQYEIAPQANDMGSVISAGFREFSIGLTGNQDQDLARLTYVAGRLEELGRYRVSLEGNAAFTEPAHLRQLWDEMKAVPALQKLCRSIQFIEQPFPVDASLTNAVVALFAEWPGRPAILIDEAATGFGSCARSLEWGYAGVAYRADSGLIPGIVDACLLCARMDREPIGKWTLASALSSKLAPSVLSELAVASALGMSSVIAPAALFQPNGEDFPAPWREQLATAHPHTFNADLSLQHEGGVLALSENISKAPLGCLVQLDPTALLQVG